MRNLILICVVALLAFSCSSGPGGDLTNQYLIEGTAGNASPGEKILLEHYTLAQLLVVDTGVVADDGSFELKGDIMEKGLYRMRLERDPRFQWMMIMDNGDYLKPYIDLQESGNYKFEKSEVNNQIKNFMVFLGGFNEEMKALQQQATAAIQSNDQAKLAQVQMQQQQKNALVQQVIKTNADTSNSDPFLKLYYISFMMGDRLMQKTNFDYVNAFYQQFQQQAPSSSYLTQIKAQLDNTQAKFAQQQMQQQQQQQQQAAANNQLNNPAPEINLPTPAGSSLALSSLKGNYVLIDFWASWCRPCRAENPNVVKLYNKYKDKGFTVYSVSLDKDKVRWEQAIEQDGLTWTNHVSDLAGWRSVAAATYGVNSIPRTFLMDPEGKIIAANLRGPALETKLAELFGG